MDFRTIVEEGVWMEAGEHHFLCLTTTTQSYHDTEYHTCGLIEEQCDWRGGADHRTGLGDLRDIFMTKHDHQTVFFCISFV